MFRRPVKEGLFKWRKRGEEKVKDKNDDDDEEKVDKED